MTILVMILSFLGGVVATSAFYRKRIEEHREANAEIERDIIRAAIQCGGRITALDVRSGRARSIEAVERELRRLHANGYCENDLTADGHTVYVFRAFDEAPQRALRIEAMVLQIARLYRGFVEVSKIAAETELSYVEARRLLDDMSDQGICEPTENPDVYRFFPSHGRRPGQAQHL